MSDSRDEEILADLRARRFMLFGGPDVTPPSGGLGDYLAEARTALEAVEAADRAFKEPTVFEGETIPPIRWAHIFDVIGDRLIEVPSTPQAREVLIEELGKGT